MLVNGNCSTRDGSLPLRLGVVCAFHCFHDLCGYQPAGLFIVNSMQNAHYETEHAKVLAYRDELMLQLDAIEKRLDQLSK